jgi:two-component system LytT family sensor kinase
MTQFFRSRQFTVLLHIIIWGSLLIVPAIITSGVPQSQRGGYPHLFFTVNNLVNIGLFYGNAHGLYPALVRKGWRWLLYLPSLAAAIFICYWLKVTLAGLLYSQNVVQKSMAHNIAFFSSFLFVIISIIYRLVLDNRRKERIQKEKLAMQQATELKFLRSQINPHFLFNVLNNMVSLARQKSDQLEPSLIKLSGIMRYMLYESDENKVPVSKEVEYLQHYVALQQLRFDDQLRIETSIEMNDTEYLLAPMLLISFVENAFKHGTGLNPDPFIKISLRVHDQVLQFDVVNSFEEGAMTSKDKESGIGLQNVQTRLELLYPKQHLLSFKKENNLFHVSLTLQLA